MLPRRLASLSSRIIRAVRRPARAPLDSDAVAEYWTRHNVTFHKVFGSAEESLSYFHWRNSQYPGYIALMPVAGFDGRSVLDFGCGPGHDLVGFSAYSRCARLVGVDVSATSIAEASSRLGLHGAEVETRLIRAGEPLPYPDGSFDHVHSSGVLHHLADPAAALGELRRVLKPGGTAHIMVYNFDSIWMHLKVAYLRSLVEGLYPHLPLRERFARSTDGDECPIASCYRPAEFQAVAREAGFTAVFAGAAISLIELALLHRRYEAMMDSRLPAEHREFLESLTFNEQLMPLTGDHLAGIAGVYHLHIA